MLSVGTVRGEQIGVERHGSGTSGSGLLILGMDWDRGWTPPPWSGNAARPAQVGGGQSQPRINHNFLDSKLNLSGKRVLFSISLSLALHLAVMWIVPDHNK